MLELILASILPVLKIILICGIGAVCARKGLINSEGRRVLGGLSWVVFNPSLIFCKLGATLTPARLIQWWPLILNTGLSTALGMLLGDWTVRLIRPPSFLKAHTIVAVALGNLGNLSLTIVTTMAESNPGVMKGVPPDQAEALAVSYVMMGLLIPCTVHATIGFNMLRKHEPKLPAPPPTATSLADDAVGNRNGVAGTTQAATTAGIEHRSGSRKVLDAQQQQDLCSDAVDAVDSTGHQRLLGNLAVSSSADGQGPQQSQQLGSSSGSSGHGGVQGQVQDCGGSIQLVGCHVVCMGPASPGGTPQAAGHSEPDRGDPERLEGLPLLQGGRVQQGGTGRTGPGSGDGEGQGRDLLHATPPDDVGCAGSGTLPTSPGPDPAGPATDRPLLHQGSGGCATAAPGLPAAAPHPFHQQLGISLSGRETLGGNGWGHDTQHDENPPSTSGRTNGLLITTAPLQDSPSALRGGYGSFRSPGSFLGRSGSSRALSFSFSRVQSGIGRWLWQRAHSHRATQAPPPGWQDPDHALPYTPRNGVDNRGHRSWSGRLASSFSWRRGGSVNDDAARQLLRPRRVRTPRDWPSRLKSFGKFALQQAMSPPLLSILVSIFVGCVRPLQAAFFGPNAPLSLVTSSLDILGECTIPAILLLLGATLSHAHLTPLTGPGEAKVPWRIIWAVGLQRLLIVPLLGILLVLGSYALHAFSAPDPVFILVMLLQNTAPTAILVHTMASVNQNHDAEVSAILFWTYAAAIITTPLFLVLFLWAVDRVFHD